MNIPLTVIQSVTSETFAFLPVIMTLASINFGIFNWFAFVSNHAQSRSKFYCRHKLDDLLIGRQRPT